MSLLTNRIIHDDNGTLLDLSKDLNNKHSGTSVIGIVAADDFLYIGSEFPFANRYFGVSTANALASEVSVDLWDGTEWAPAVDVQDETDSSGATLATSGFISWKLARDKSWAQQDTEDMTGSGLETLAIYGLYWARLSFSGNLTGTTALGVVGHKFNSDNDFGALYAHLNTSSAKTQFESGKTNWEVQSLEVADQIIRDLKRRPDLTLLSPNQILDPDQLRHAAVHGLAALIYNEFGDDYLDSWEKSRKLYTEALDDVYKFDLNRNARLDDHEFDSGGRVVRR